MTTRAPHHTSSQQSEIVDEIEQRRTQLNAVLMRIYTSYRILIGITLFTAFQQPLFMTQLGRLKPEFFSWAVLVYIGANLVIAFATRKNLQRESDPQKFGITIVIADILALTYFVYASGGVGSGLTTLLLITVCTGAILVTGRRATFIAATASLAILGEELYLAAFVADAPYDLFQAGIFGALFFAASFGIQNLSNKLRNKDIKTLTQAAELAGLERLNRQIIQRMRTGIIVTDEHNRVRMHNESALALIGADVGQDLTHLPAALLEILQHWRTDTSLRPPPLRIKPATPEIRAYFAAVRPHEVNGYVTLFLEDNGELQQQAQQLKLAEVGRLSASIAHEVRNPLGAISHAAQLLKESDAMVGPDQRLTDIIISHCLRMNDVVENVLQMSRRKPPEPHLVNLSQHIDDFVRTFKQARPEADIKVSVTTPAINIKMDPQQLNQALTNLVDNGLRYSVENHKPASVELIGGLDAVSGRPFLNVIDYGVGVDPNLEPNLFQPFSTTAKSGTGLGLYLSRELCEANQAQLSYTRDDEQRSCFRILFMHPRRITPPI